MNYKEMQERDEKIRLLRKEGLTLEKIGQKFNLNRERIRQIVLNIQKKKRELEEFPVKCRACGEFFKRYSSQRIFCDKCSLHLRTFSGRERTREVVRIIYKHTCQKCGKKWDESMRRFDIHHLNGICGKKSRGYDKFIDFKDLIVYCHKCHLNLEEVIRKMSESYWTNKNKKYGKRNKVNDVRKTQ